MRDKAMSKVGRSGQDAAQLRARVNHYQLQRLQYLMAHLKKQELAEEADELNQSIPNKEQTILVENHQENEAGSGTELPGIKGPGK